MESIIEKLKIKKSAKKLEPIEILIPNSDSEITIKTSLQDDDNEEQTIIIENRTKEKLINRKEFLDKISKTLKIKDKKTDSIKEVIQEEEKEITIPKTKKTIKKIKLSVDEENPEVAPKKRRTKPIEKEIISEGPITMVKIGDTSINNRLPPKKKDILRASAYYLNNREVFINFINSLFKPYKDELKDIDENVDCSSKTSNFEIMTHQKIVRDYLALYTPYRGLLLYHGLGSGKTCSSIAIAEGLKSDKQILILTPASLQRNYIEELKKCGDPIYKKNQFWEFISLKDDKDNKLLTNLSKILQISENYIKKNKGAWMVNVSKKANYDTLNDNETKILDNQINEMIRTKYKFINYNGIRPTSGKNNWRDMTSNYKINPFDNKVVIIDEAHNFVSLIVNSLKEKDSMWQQMYHDLMNADNVKIVLLSGTPIINYPNEISITFNILRGYIKTWNIPLNIKTSEKVNKDFINSIFKTFNILDELDYTPSSKILSITRNPFGFINKTKSDKYIGVAKPKQDERGDINDDDFLKIISSILREKDIEILRTNIQIDLYKALPDDLDSFKEYFIDSSGKLKNEILFKRRILGLASYFRSAQEQLMPKYDAEIDFKKIEIPMSDYQFEIYEKARVVERKRDASNAKKRAVAKNKTDGIYEDAVSNYRIFSRAFCNFVFPDNKRPMPKEEENIEDINLKTVDEDLLDASSVEDKIMNSQGKFTEEDSDALAKIKDADSDTSYKRRIEEAIEFLKRNQSNYLSKDGLQIYSPKFLNILENIENPDNQGLHLVYSRFKTLEGITIFKLVLEANGFAELKIKRQDNKWILDVLEKDYGKPMFILYTGDRSEDEKEILRNIYNSNWKNIDISLSSELEKISENNHMGQIVKVFMITAAGAEGISLKNTRFVHIMEPYWHPVLIEQVIGRAKRICSHQDLPKELRTVEVFLYLMTFTEDQKTSEDAVELRLKDRSKFDNITPITSDEALYEISTIKEQINKKILTLVKESSIDCSIYSSTNKKEKIKCFSFGKPNVNKFSYNPSIANEEKDLTAKSNLSTLSFKADEIEIAGKQYIIDKKTNKIYDYESVIAAQETGSNPIQIGSLELKNKKYIFKKI
jgi:hypothetical protein